MKKKTIGLDPLEAYLSFGKKEKNASKNKRETLEMPEKTSQLTKQKKQRITIHLSTDLIERMKNAVFWEPGLTVTSFAQTALESALKKLEKSRGDGYPARKAHLKGGRLLS